MTVRLRSVIFWLHLAAGVGAGSIVLLMSVTGVLLMYERQVIEWADRGYRLAPPPAGAAGARLSVEALISRVVAAEPGAPPSSLMLAADPAAPAAVSFGRERTVYADAYSGRILGESSPRVRAFFRSVTAWHRWLGAQGENRDTGRAVTGTANLAFLILVVSGLYLWLPRQWTRRQVKNVAWFRRGLAGKARDFNWHNVVGLWAWLPLLLVVLTGVVMSYPWANDLLFRLGGEEPPPRQGERQAGEARGPRGGREGRRSPSGEEGRGRREGERGGGPERPGEGALAPDGIAGLASLDELWLAAEKRVPGWRSITLRLPEEAGDPATFTILRGHRGRPDLRAQLVLDRQSGEVVKWEPYASQGPGRKLRAWARWVHTGEAGGLLGQTVAGIASAGAALLVWTGWAMAWRRFFPAKTKQAVRSNEAASAAREMT